MYRICGHMSSTCRTSPSGKRMWMYKKGGGGGIGIRETDQRGIDVGEIRQRVTRAWELAMYIK